jgi:UDP-2,3-diacylglucosamine hydrolase
MTAAPADPGEGPLAIICGGGALPFAVADAVMRRGRSVVFFPVRGGVDPKAVARDPHHIIDIGRYGRVHRQATAAGCRDEVMIGTGVRPALRDNRVEWEALRELPTVIRMFRGGDNHLLSILARLFEKRGFRFVGAHEVAPEILMPPGTLGRREPSARDRADIARGVALLSAVGPFDVGQAVVVADNYVLAIEAAEGTDRMLARVAELRSDGRVRSAIGTGVLVKMPKPAQDRRFDLPAIGPTTVAGAARAGLAGIAVTAAATIVAEPAEVGAAADRAGIFVTGIAPGEREP